MTEKRHALSSRIAEVTAFSSDPASLRQVLGRFVTGITIITTCSEEGSPVGLTANSFNTLSLDPALVLWSLGVRQGSCDTFRKCARFAINILAEDQVDLSRQFSRPVQNRFEGVGYTCEQFGVPLIKDCLAWLVCDQYQNHDIGDHILFIGRVLALGQADRKPLAYHAGAYSRVDVLPAPGVHP